MLLQCCGSERCRRSAAGRLLDVEVICVPVAMLDDDVLEEAVRGLVASAERSSMRSSAGRGCASRISAGTSRPDPLRDHAGIADDRDRDQLHRPKSAARPTCGPPLASPDRARRDHPRCGDPVRVGFPSDPGEIVDDLAGASRRIGCDVRAGGADQAIPNRIRGGDGLVPAVLPSASHPSVAGGGRGRDAELDRPPGERIDEHREDRADPSGGDAVLVERNQRRIELGGRPARASRSTASVSARRSTNGVRCLRRGDRCRRRRRAAPPATRAPERGGSPGRAWSHQLGAGRSVSAVNVGALITSSIGVCRERPAATTRERRSRSVRIPSSPSRGRRGCSSPPRPSSEPQRPEATVPAGRSPGAPGSGPARLGRPRRGGSRGGAPSGLGLSIATSDRPEPADRQAADDVVRRQPVAERALARAGLPSSRQAREHPRMPERLALAEQVEDPAAVSQLDGPGSEHPHRVGWPLALAKDRRPAS